MQIAELRALLPGCKLHSGFTMSQEQMVLLPVVVRVHDRIRFAVAFAGVVVASDGAHTINIALTYFGGKPHLFMTCGSPYLEGLDIGDRFKRARSAVSSLGEPPTASFERGTQAESRMDYRWRVVSRIEQIEPRLESLVAQNFDTYPPSKFCAYTKHGFSDKSPCEHITHALARLRLSGQNFISHMQEKFIALHEHYTGETLENRPELETASP